MSMLKKRALLECGCGCGSEICCNRCLPLNCFTGEPVDPLVCQNALPLTLQVVLSATPSFGDSTCFNGSGALTFLTPLTPGGVCCWQGRISGSCTDCNGNTFNWYVDLTVCCGGEEVSWGVSASVGAPCVMGDMGADSVVVPASCDPVLLQGCFAEQIVGCVVACFDTMPPTPGPTYDLCFEIFETP